MILFRSRIRRRINTPLRWQFQPTECGVAVLRIMLAWFGRDVAAHEVRRVTGVSRDCLNAADLSRAARAFGLDCRARSLDTAALSTLSLPVIVHLRFIHFAVLEAIDRRGVRLNCPHGGILEQPIELFDEAFTGVVLELFPGPRFARVETSGPGERGWWLRLGSAAWLPALAATACAVARAGGAGLAAFTARTGQLDRTTVGWMAAGIAVALAASVGERSMLRQGERRIHRTLQTSLVAKLQAVSFDFYAYRLPGTLHAVMQLPRSLAVALVGRVAPAWHALVESVLLLAVAGLLDAGVGLALAAAFAAWLAIVVALSRWRRRTERAQADPTDALIAARWQDYLQRAGRNRLAEGPDALRLETAGLLAARQHRRACVGPAPAFLPAAPALLMAACLTIVLATAPESSSAGSLGLVLVAGMLGLAATPLTRLRGVLDGLRRGAFMVRDVLDEPVSPPLSQHVPKPCGEPRDASVTVEGVAFGFNPNNPPLIRHASLTIAPGEHLGLSGPPGSGKSTLTEIMVGLHQPQSGTVKIGGIRLDSLSTAARARLIALIGRRPVVFEGTIRENLTLWDDGISDADLKLAIDDACLTDVIAERPGGLDAAVEAQGRNFSGGQMQRLEIARALVRRPRIVIVDDALDALDPVIESRVRSALRRRGCTVLIVSQRAPSLIACDRVLHLADGMIGASPDAVVPPKSLPLLAHILSGDGAPLPPAASALAPTGARAEALLAAVRIVLPGASGAAEDIGGLTTPAAIAQLARARDHWVRPVRFTVPQWWGDVAGPVLAFRKDGSPVAIVPGAAGPVLVNSQNRSHARITPALLSDLDTLAYTFEPLGRPADGRPPVQFPSWAGAVGIDATRCLVTGAALTPLPILFLVAVAQADRPAKIAAAGALAAGAALLWHLHQVATARMLHRLETQECTFLQRFALTVDGGAIRRLPPWRLSFAASRLTGMARRWADTLGGGFPAAALLLGACAGVAWLGGWCALAASAVGAAFCLVLDLARGWAARRSLAAYAWTRRAAQDRLTALLCGIGRVRALAVDDRILLKWREDEEVESNFWRRTRALSAWGWAFSLPLPASLYALGEAPLTVAAGWVVAGAALAFGRIVARFVAEGAATRAAGHLVVLRRPDGVRRIDPHASRITADRMKFRYPAASAPLFDELSLDIDPRAITVLAGPSGAGKSTLLRLLLGLEAPDSGTLRIGGHAAGETDLAAWQGRIAAVFQGDQLDGAATIRAHLGVNTEVGPAEIWTALAMVEMADKVRALPMALQSIVEPGRISAGEQQRLLIARALLRKPVLLAMDEATGAITDDVQARLLARLRAQGIGCLIVSHRETVIDAADRVHVLDRGRIVFSGAPDALGAQLPMATDSRQPVAS